MDWRVVYLHIQEVGFQGLIREGSQAMGWFGFALILVGVLANLILWVIFKSTDYNLSVLPYMWLALIVKAVGFLLVVADEARAILARRKIRLGKKDQMEAK